MPYMLYHILSGDPVFINSEELISMGYRDGVTVWRSKHSVRWMLISAINSYNDAIDNNDFNANQSAISNGNRVQLSEFFVVKLPLDSDLKPTKPTKPSKSKTFTDSWF